MVISRKTMLKFKSPSVARIKLSPRSPVKTSNVKVIVRVRQDSNVRKEVEVVSDNMLTFYPNVEEESCFHEAKQNSINFLKKQQKGVTYVFDKVFGSNSNNMDIFEESTKELIKSLLDGYNCSVFVYGATGTGKTYTMFGNSNEPGIAHLTMAELYRQIELLDDRKFDVKVSYLEIYNENLIDLLNPSGQLHLLDSKCGTFVSGLKCEEIDNIDKLLTLLHQGNNNRTQHPTHANAESTRSHAVFQVHIRMVHKQSNQMKLVKFSMIDLAGSEKPSCTGMRFTEGTNINKSLLTLGIQESLIL